jgi:hypothetical protein
MKPKVTRIARAYRTLIPCLIWGLRHLPRCIHPLWVRVFEKLIRWVGGERNFGEVTP